jgi:DNA-binding CsgD family transcriptional regulator
MRSFCPDLLSGRKAASDDVPMDGSTLQSGWTAFAAGDWEVAKRRFEAAIKEDPSPESIDALGRTLWWMKDVAGAVEARTAAYGAYRQTEKLDEAARIAVWLARELRMLFRNDVAADGWLARAQTLATELDTSSVYGWIALARAEASLQASDAVTLGERALAIAREHRDRDLEVISLARLGLIEVATGEVESGVIHLDESMAAATGLETSDAQYAAEAYCCLMEASELLGDSNRFAQWSAAISTVQGRLGPLEGLGSSSAYGNLSAFCASCCGGMYLVTGRLDEAESELQQAIVDLESSGLQSRCVHPVTQLAELRVLQGRFEEARALLEPYEDLPEAVRPSAVLDLALGDPEGAMARLERRIEELGDVTVSAQPLQTVLVDACISARHLNAAATAVKAIQDVATLTGSNRHAAEALFSEGKLLSARGDATAANVLRTAALRLSEASMALDACRARMELARTLSESNKPVAISEARAALAAFDRLGATLDADAAAAFLRELGVRGRTGPKNLDLLTKREREVLRLVAQGFSNGEIADRLFISIKTAGHHVSNILSKLGLRSRTEAAAFAPIHLPQEPVGK